jgi:hypothetical protein
LGRRFRIFRQNISASQHDHQQQIASIFDSELSRHTDQGLSISEEDTENAKNISSKLKAQSLRHNKATLLVSCIMP